MGGKFSRDKGQRAERNVIAILQPVVTRVYEALGLAVPELKRNLMQTNGGGFDIAGLDWIAIEVKHHEQLHVADWWEQTVKQSKSGGNIERVPVLFYKSNGLKWHVMMEGLVEIEKDVWPTRTEMLVDGVKVMQPWSGDGRKGKKVRCPVTISQESFLLFFEHRLRLEASKNFPQTK